MRKPITLGSVVTFGAIAFIVWMLLMVQGCVPPPSVGIRSSTGKELDRGLELLCKVGSKYPDLQDPNHTKGWRDGQIADIRPLGFYTGDMIRKHHCVIQFPNVDYWTLRGDIDWKSTKQSVMNLKKFLSVKDINGKYVWESGFTESKERSRDYFVDFKRLLNTGFINQKQYDSIYNKETDHEKIELRVSDIQVIFRNEDVHTRLSIKKDQIKGSVTTGTFSIGSGLNYDTVTAAELDIGTPLTGNLTFEHNNEETSISGVVTFDTQTSTYLLKLTAQSGDEHNGGAYGNGARINFGAYDKLIFNETTAGHLDDVEISKLAIDATGDGNIAVTLDDGGDSGSGLVNRMLVKAGAYGIIVYNTFTNSIVRNNIIYDTTVEGLRTTVNSTDRAIEMYNNTVIKCVKGIEILSSGGATVTMKNNLCQGNTTADYVNFANADVTAKNISEDASSGNDAYDNLNAHDATSSFVDYANDDYKLTTGGTDNGTIDDGDDLSGTFTDDIDGGVARDTWWIGAHELPVVGNGADKTGQVIRVRKRRR